MTVEIGIGTGPDGCRARHPRPVLRAFRALRTHSSPHPHQLPSRHPQVAQREQRDDLRRVLGQPPVAHLGVAELPLEHPERVLNLGADACLPLLQSQGLKVRRDERVELPALAGSHRDVPLRPLCFGSLTHPAVACITEGHLLLTVQQTACLRYVADVCRRANDPVYESRFGIDAYVRLHAEVPLVPLLRLMHLVVAFAVGVLGRARCRDQRGIDHRSPLHHQALGLQDVVDHAQHVHRQVVALQQVTEPKDRGLVRQSRRALGQLGELAEHRHVVQRFFHRRIAQREPLLKVVNAQHRFDAEGRSTGLGPGIVRLDDLHQNPPRAPHVPSLPRTRACASSWSTGSGQVRAAS